MNKIRVTIAGIGNCASSLIQGIPYYADQFAAGDTTGIGLAHPILGGYAPGDIDIVGAIDVDQRKVGQPLHEAIFAQPNNTKTIFDGFTSDVVVRSSPGLTPARGPSRRWGWGQPRATRDASRRTWVRLNAPSCPGVVSQRSRIGRPAYRTAQRHAAQHPPALL